MEDIKRGTWDPKGRGPRLKKRTGKYQMEFQPLLLSIGGKDLLVYSLSPSLSPLDLTSVGKNNNNNSEMHMTKAKREKKKKEEELK